MKNLTFAFFLFASGAVFATPVVTLGKLTFNAGKVTLRYTLANDPAVVTCDVQTESEGVWTSLDVAALKTATGEVNQLVQPGNAQHKIFLESVGGITDELIRNGRVRATLTAWPTNCPPDYLVLDLKDRTAAPKYYLSEDWIPGAVTDRVYKTEKFVLKKVHAAGEFFNMGSPTTEKNVEGTANARVPSQEGLHQVGFSRDFYLGIYAVTLGQVKCVKGDDTLTTSCYTDPSKQPDADTLPYTSVYWADWRYPVSDDQLQSRPPTRGGLFADFRGLTGFTFDLPSAAEYEYAARAGVDGPFCRPDLEWDEYIWYSGNSDGVVHSVGTLKPNFWGFYDMQGNVIEFLYDLSKGRIGDNSDATKRVSLDPIFGEGTSGTGGSDDKMRRLGSYNALPYRLATIPQSGAGPYWVAVQAARARVPAIAVR